MENKVLFIHNSTPEYRMKFWKLLEKKIKCDFLITNKNLASKIYDLDNDLSDIVFHYWDKNTIKYLKKNLQLYDCVVLPPQDSLKEIYVAHKIYNLFSKNGIKTVYWSEKWEAPWEKQPCIKKVKSIIQRVIIGMIANKTDVCIASGVKSKEYLKKIGVKEKNIYTVIDSSTSPKSEFINIKEKYSIDNNKKIILFLGRIVTRKGCYELIEALKNHLEQLNAVLLICGDGADLNRCKEKAGTNPNIIFTGVIQPKLRRNFFEQSNVFVIPSICEQGIIEAWGLTVNEALECGTPVIASDCVGAAYDLINEQNGTVFCDRNSIIIDIKKLFENENREIIKKAYSNFTVEKMSSGFYEVLRRKK